MKPLLRTVVALSLILAAAAHPENIEDVKELPQTKEPVIEAEESEPQARVERCSTCGPNVKSPKDVLAAFQALPGAEVHTQQSFEGCSSDKGCAGVKIKDGQVVQKYGNADAFKAAESADVNNEFNFLAASALNNPFWWMNQDSPFKSGGSFQKFSKASYTTSGGSVDGLDLAANPFLNGNFANAGFAAQAGVKPVSNFQSSFESAYSSKGDLDLSKNPFLNSGFKAGQAGVGQSAFAAGSASNFAAQSGYGAQGSFGGQASNFAGQGSNFAGQGSNFAGQGSAFAGQSASNFGAQGGYNGAGYTGSSPRPFATGAGVNLVQNTQKATEFDFDQQQQTQQNIDELFQSSGNVNVDAVGDFQQTCAGQGYVCVPKAQCNNGVVNTNGANIPQARTKKQYCSIRTEICCRLEVATINQGVGSFGQENLFGSNAVNRVPVPVTPIPPVAPIAPIGPIAPVAPIRPVVPVAPIRPVLPVAPIRPVIPVTPIIPDVTSQTNFIETDSFSSGSEVAGIYRPGASGTGLKPGIPYLPPVDTINSGTNIVTTAFPSPPPVVLTTPRPTVRPYIPPVVTSTSAPGYLPPIGEQTINRETFVPNPTYNEGSIILDETRNPVLKPTPIVPIVPNEIPAGCAAALKCTPIEFCTAEGVISNTSVILTRDQDAYRVPLTDCRDLETGRIGKCCRDPFYTDPWPTNQLGKWVPGVFGGNDGKYVPDSRGSSNNVRPVTPPTTGSVIFGNFRTTPKSTVPSFGSTRFPTTASPFVPKNTGQYSKGGQGQFTKGGQGQYGLGGRGQVAAGPVFRPGRVGVGVIGQGDQIGVGQVAVAQYPQLPRVPVLAQGVNTQLGTGQIGVAGQGTYSQVGRGQVGLAGVGQTTQLGVGQVGVVGQGQYTPVGRGQVGLAGVGQTLGVGQVGIGQGTYGQVGRGQVGIAGQGTQLGVGQVGVAGQGTYAQGGRGQFGLTGQSTPVAVGPVGVAGQGQYGQVGRGRVGLVGAGQATQLGVGQVGIAGQGQYAQGGSVGVGQVGLQSGFNQGALGVNQIGQGQVGRGQIGVVGQGVATQLGNGQVGVVDQGEYTQLGNGQIAVNGVGQYAQVGRGQIGVGSAGQLGAGSQVTNAFSKGQYGQGQIGTQGQGLLVSQGQGQIGSQGQGALVNQGQGALVNQGAYVGQGQGSLVSQGQGSLVSQGQGSLVSQGQGSLVSQGQGALVGQGQGALIGQGQGSLVNQGQGQLVSQGEGQLVSQGVGQIVSQGKGQYGIGGVGQYEIEGQGQQGFGIIGQAQGLSKASGQLVSQGQGQLVSQGKGQIVSQGKGQIVSQGKGQYTSQGQGTIVSQGGGAFISQGEGQSVSQGFGQGIRQGQGFSVLQGGGVGVENEYGETVQRVFLQRYNGAGQCGVLNPQKPYGNKNDLEVDFAEIPWQAMVLLQTNRSLLCGGVITRPDVVITSASCVEGLDAKNVLIKGGEWKLGIDDEPLPFQIVQVKTILRHPFYRRGSLLYDAAILVLNENLRLAKNIQPICLPSASDTLDAFYNGAGECIVTGWGKIVLQAHLEGSIMHSLNVSLVNPGECQAKLSSDYPHLLEQYSEDSCVCGQPTNPLNNICKVDIGSALACTSGDGRYVMRGVYSWDSGCQIGNQIAGFYKFDLEWYEWAIGLIESVRFAQYSQVTSGKFTGQIKGQFGSGVKTSQFGSGFKSGQFGSGVKSTQFGGTKGSANSGSAITTGSGSVGYSGVKEFGVSGKGQYFQQGSGLAGISGQKQVGQFTTGQFNQFGIGSGQVGFESSDFNGQIKSPITNSYTATYSEKKVFQTEPKIITYTTKPEIVTFTTKPEIFTYTTKPKIITYTTKPKIITYTTKPQIITYETSGSGTNPQYVAPGVTFNPSFSELVGAHSHTSKCKCLENK